MSKIYIPGSGKKNENDKEVLNNSEATLQFESNETAMKFKGNEALLKFDNNETVLNFDGNEAVINLEEREAALELENNEAVLSLEERIEAADLRRERLKANPVLKLIKSQMVLCIATIAMVVTCVIVPPDAAYKDYFNWGTLACLFCTLLVVAGYKNIHFFEMLAERIVIVFKNTRNAITGLVFITYFASMLLANDMALLTFLPLGFFVLKSTGKMNYMAFTFVMQNIAANLGGMITPFGNPQNLHLYSFYMIPTAEFFGIMLRPFIVATVLIIVTCMFVKKEPLTLKTENTYNVSRFKAAAYSVLFVLSIMIVFRAVDFVAGTIIIAICMLALDVKSYKEVNYGLLLTFCVFFVFSGNMSRIPAVEEFLGGLINKNPLLYGILSCQFISNVPSAVLLSRFTGNYTELLKAVNMGGLGTLIASLASLITFSEFKKHKPEAVKSYMVMFSALNFGFLAVLYLVEKLNLFVI